METFAVGRGGVKYPRSGAWAYGLAKGDPARVSGYPFGKNAAWGDEAYGSGEYD